MAMDRMNTSSAASVHKDIRASFAEWLEIEKQRGLIDMKFALSTGAGNNPSAAAVMQEILDSERLIAEGDVEELIYDSL